MSDRTPLDEIRERYKKASYPDTDEIKILDAIAGADLILHARTDIPCLLAEVSSLESQRDTALANADFLERELNNFRRNAAHRAEQLAKEKVESLEVRLQAAENELGNYRILDEVGAAELVGRLQCEWGQMRERAELAESRLRAVTEALQKTHDRLATVSSDVVFRPKRVSEQLYQIWKLTGAALGIKAHLLAPPTEPSKETK
jgi:hypothetical protein